MSLLDASKLIKNSIKYPQRKAYAAIVGANPSNGARSPVLWNSAFRAHDSDMQMLPMDITEDKLCDLLYILEMDCFFVGGAIAAPYKEMVARWLGSQLTPEAKVIGSVNCLYRDADGKLTGENTDGKAALNSFEATFGSVVGKTVVLIGPGGAGRAVATEFQKAVGDNGKLILVGRSELGKQFANRIGSDWIEWNERLSALPDADVLINCTTLGSADYQDESPLTAKELTSLPSRVVMFDIIYNPTPSLFLTFGAMQGIKILDGQNMNLEQAILAFGYAAEEINGSQVTRVAMEFAKKNLI
jgi:shikimate dehydrogenase